VTAALDELLAAHLLPDASGDKRDRGSVVVVGGSPGCPGAALLAGVAALRAGAGRVQLGVHPDVATAVAVALPEAFVSAWDHGRARVPDDLAGRIERASAVVVGPGLLTGAGNAARAVAELVPDETPLLLDAGALEVALELAAGPARCLVVAPNDDEAKDLGAGNADELAARLGGRSAAVRGVETTVVDGHGGRWHHAADVDGLGTAGSGDVFAGIAAGLLARGAAPLAALGWAVAVHARAGAIAADAVAPVGFLAREVADGVPTALRALRAP
jgi:hydroxyethylthiazole kinase-like uncharacterized protein yjeF